MAISEIATLQEGFAYASIIALSRKLTSFPTASLRTSFSLTLPQKVIRLLRIRQATGTIATGTIEIICRKKGRETILNLRVQEVYCEVKVKHKKRRRSPPFKIWVFGT